jgi:hypothetical protein
VSATWHRAALALIVVVCGTAIIGAFRRTSTTFDEVVGMTAGVRGFGTGDWDMVHDMPPVMQYLYGMPVYLAGPNLPPEVRNDTTPHRYVYARQLLWGTGNDAEKLIFLARMVAAACALVLVLLTYKFATDAGGRGAGLMAATLVAFLPDVLAHGGIAYNDIALAPAFLAALIAIDAAVRKPSIARGALAGALASLALGIKHSAFALGPIALVLLLLEAAREDRRDWLRGVLAAAVSGIVVGYLVQVLLYRGDFRLTDLVNGTIGLRSHLTYGHGIASYLLGQASTESFKYFYPVAFIFKTPVAFQVLLLVALLGALKAVRGKPLSSIFRSPVRAYIVALVIFMAFLLRSNLTIGFRYALPVLPLLCVLIAVGTMQIWSQSRRAVRAGIVALTLWSAGSALSFYPDFIAYTSEHQPDRDTGYDVYVDSNLDWGQGLKELRAFMREEKIPQVYLSYFGSAVPEGYGIDYIPLPSFFPLPFRPIPQTNRPKFVAVSATNLVGLYLPGDPFAMLRRMKPYKVLGHSMFVFHVPEEKAR